MAKRFTDTDKWKREFFCELSPQGKLVWIYILDQCDHRGVWIRNFKLMSDQVGFRVNQELFEKWLGAKVKLLENDKYLIPSFIEFQYGELKSSNHAHIGIIRMLEKSGVSLGPSEGLVRGSLAPQDKDKEKDSSSFKETQGVEKECYAEFQKMWNENRGPFQKVLLLTEKRKQKISARLKENPDLNYWLRLLNELKASEFCCGKNDRKWMANFDWFIRPDTHIYISEGKYSTRKVRDHSKVHDAIDELRRRNDEKLFQNN